MTRQSFARIDCPVARSADVLGDKWTLVIVRNAFQGMRRYDEFAEHLGVAANVLADRLSRLVKAGVLARHPCPTDGRAVEYRLTPKGLELFPLVVFLSQWGERWYGKRAGARIELRDRRSGLPLAPVEVLAEDGARVTARESSYGPGPGGSTVLSHSRAIVSRRRAVHSA